MKLTYLALDLPVRHLPCCPFIIRVFYFLLYLRSTLKVTLTYHHHNLLPCLVCRRHRSPLKGWAERCPVSSSLAPVTSCSVSRRRLTWAENRSSYRAACPWKKAPRLTWASRRPSRPGSVAFLRWTPLGALRS